MAGGAPPGGLLAVGDVVQVSDDGGASWAQARVTGFGPRGAVFAALLVPYAIFAV